MLFSPLTSRRIFPDGLRQLLSICLRDTTISEHFPRDAKLVPTLRNEASDQDQDTRDEKINQAQQTQLTF